MPSIVFVLNGIVAWVAQGVLIAVVSSPMQRVGGCGGAAGNDPAAHAPPVFNMTVISNRIY